MTLGDNDLPCEAAEDSPALFAGRDLPRAIGQVSPDSLLGPWTTALPHRLRPGVGRRPGFYSPEHSHDHAEACQLLNGTCVLAYAGKRSLLRTGDLVFCPPGLPHAEGFVRPGLSYELIWWILPAGGPFVQMTRYARATGFAVVNRIPCDDLPADSRRALARLRSMIVGTACPEVTEVREVLLALALALLRRTRAVRDPARLDARPEVVRRAVEFVRANAHRAIHVDDVSRAVLLSPNYLTALFGRHTGTSLGRFIAEERVARARDLLGEGRLSVKEVAEHLDFPDAYAFSRVFKRITGHPPSRLKARP